MKNIHLIKSDKQTNLPLSKLEIAKNIAAIGIGKEKPKQETLEEAAKKYGREQPLIKSDKQTNLPLSKLEIAKNIAAIGIGKEKPKQETLEEAAKKYGREQPYQDLFNYLANELNVIALQTQMQDIEAIVMAKQKQINND